jgi:hypothetical protein
MTTIHFPFYCSACRIRIDDLDFKSKSVEAKHINLHGKNAAALDGLDIPFTCPSCGAKHKVRVRLAPADGILHDPKTRQVRPAKGGEFVGLEVEAIT